MRGNESRADVTNSAFTADENVWAWIKYRVWVGTRPCFRVLVLVLAVWGSDHFRGEKSDFFCFLRLVLGVRGWPTCFSPSQVLKQSNDSVQESLLTVDHMIHRFKITVFKIFCSVNISSFDLHWNSEERGSFFFCFFLFCWLSFCIFIWYSIYVFSLSCHLHLLC